MANQKKDKLQMTNKKLDLASDNLKIGVTNRAFYSTMAAFEHFDSGRSQKFPYTNTVQEIAGSEHVKIDTRETDSIYPQPYNIVTRERNELFIYGGNVRGAEGSYVAKIDADSLKEIWRVKLKIEGNNGFSWPGLVAVHGNGQLYATAGNLLAKINPDTGEHKIIELPEHKGQGGSVYNGFDISDDGIIFLKCMEPGTPTMVSPKENLQSLAYLRSVAMNCVPAFVVAVNPHNLDILSVLEAPEAGLGRVTCERRDGVDYIYFLGITRLWRYIYINGGLELDLNWTPETYISGHSQGGTAVGLMGDWVIFQTNFIAAEGPLTVFAVNIWNSEKVFSIQPFPNSPASYEWSKPAIDIENKRVYTNDQAANMVAGIDFNPQTGFTLAWKKPQGHMTSFWSIIGDKDKRQIIGNDFRIVSASERKKGDRIIWRDANTGKEIVSTKILDERSNPSIVTPGFQGRFYYFSQTGAKLIELTPVAKRD